MLGWALATFVKGMKIRLRKNWLSILKRENPQSRNCLWCDELMINYDRYGFCCVQECMNEWTCITFCNQARCTVWGWQGGNFPLSLCRFCLFWGLSAQSRKVMVKIPLPSCSPPMIFIFVCLFFFGCQLGGRSWPSTPTPLCKFLDKFLKSEKNVSESSPPPPPHIPTHTHPLATFSGLAQKFMARAAVARPPPQANFLAPPLVLPNYGNNSTPPPPPPPRWLSFSRASAVLSETFCPDCGSVVASLPWCGMVVVLLGVHGEVTVHVAG